MNKKFYETPSTEQLKIVVEAGFLTVSGGESGANASAMNSDSWDSWD